MNKELIEIQQEETEQYIKQLEQARARLNDKRELSEFDLPIDDRNDFINILNKFIEEKLSFLYTMQDEQEQGINFYEERVYAFKPIGTEDFEALPLTKEEKADINNLIENDINYYKERGDF